MYCSNCGEKIEAADTFCPKCGNRAESETKKKVSFSKKSIGIILGVIAAAILVFTISKSNSVNSTPEDVAKAAVTSEYEADIDLMVKCFPDFTIRELALEYGLSADASRSEVKQMIEKEYRYETPSRVRDVKAEVLDIFSIDEITFLKELYDDMTDNEYEAITEIAKVEVTFTVDGEAEDVQLTCIKMKGKWYLLRGA